LLPIQCHGISLPHLKQWTSLIDSGTFPFGVKEKIIIFPTSLLRSSSSKVYMLYLKSRVVFVCGKFKITETTLALPPFFEVWLGARKAV